MTILPALPAGALAPAGHTMTADEARAALAELGRDDFEAAHIAEDSMLRGVLEAIRDGHPGPVGLATAALTVLDAQYSRWSA